jgi:hypothetical protein
MTMAKILLRTLLILLAAGLVAGGIYLLTVNGIISLGGANASHSPENGGGFARGGALSQPPGGGQLHDRGGLEGQSGFSLSGLSGVAVQAGKIALLTLLVVVVKAITQIFKRCRPHHAGSAAV